ncbi:glycosyltransferase family 4 protein [Halorubrum vacuolatum]|uniref:Glycosyltransferase involved in cell wall bisynthesis n=1 Tax=Halorubrum vacuolatum TaxID=63740 RepID=A0A238WF49_HALVU|nr:glycosyltransferase family 4 protein [Halorubrum vacuolatum]SNR45202.1 Glycosyltransferase involved in cell wall bisynthesis [Halorubrum vacuolatum]
MAGGGDGPLRVGFVVYGELDERSGGYLYDRRLVDHLRGRGLDVDVISLPERRYRRAIATNATPGLVDRLRACDVVVQDAFCHPSVVLCNRRLRDTPVIALVHYLRSAATRRPWRGGTTATARMRVWTVTALERAYLRGVDGYIHNSSATRGAVAALVGTPSAELHDVVAPPAGDRLGTGRSPSAEHLRGEPFRVVFVGNVTPRKGVKTLIQGLARIDAPWELRVVGDTAVDPECVADARTLAKRRGVAEAVSFLGRVDDERLREELRDAHVLAVPSRYEPFGIVYLEGMAFGLPAIAAARGGAEEFVNDTNGALIPPEDPAAVADAIEPLIRDRDRLGRMSRAARETFERHPNWEDTCDRIRRFLAGVADRPDRYQ